MLVIGKLLGDLPSGTLVARTGERTAMLIACAVSLVGIGLAMGAGRGREHEEQHSDQAHHRTRLLTCASISSAALTTFELAS